MFTLARGRFRRRFPTPPLVNLRHSNVKWLLMVSPYLTTCLILQNAIMVGVNSFLRQHRYHCTPAQSLKRCSSRVPAMSSMQLKRLATKPVRGSQIGGETSTWIIGGVLVFRCHNLSLLFFGGEGGKGYTGIPTLIEELRFTD